MNTQRPVNLDLTKISFPLVAIISILHRISGVILFLFLPLFLYFLYEAYSPNTFLHLVFLLMHSSILKLAVWLGLSAVFFHLCTGIRHLIMDLGFLETKQAGKVTAAVTLVVAFIIIVLLGIWIW